MAKLCQNQSPLGANVFPAGLFILHLLQNGCKTRMTPGFVVLCPSTSMRYSEPNIEESCRRETLLVDLPAEVGRVQMLGSMSATGFRFSDNDCGDR